MSKLLILFLKPRPGTLQRELISAACIGNIVPLVTRHSLWPEMGDSICRFTIHTRLFINHLLHFPYTFEQNSKSSNSLLTWSGHTTFVQLRTMASDLELLNCIPATSHSPSNHPSATQRSWLDEINRTTSSAKRNDKTTKPFTLLTLAEPRTYVHKNCDKNWSVLSAQSDLLQHEPSSPCGCTETRNNQKQLKLIRHKRQFVAHNLRHAVLACDSRRKLLILSCCNSGAKVTPFPSRPSSWELNSHISRWCFPHS